MQNKYVGDIGDYVKYALLRALMRRAPDCFLMKCIYYIKDALLRMVGKRKCALGVAWYLYPDESGNDGRHTEYLDDPNKWACLDEDLFDVLRDIVCVQQRREVAAIEESGILRGAKFYREELRFPDNAPHGYTREEFRKDWFKRLRNKLDGCQIVFADPYNSLYGEGYEWGNQNPDWKRIPLCEAKALVAKGRTGVFYHHFNHQETHDAQIVHWKKQLGGACKVCAVRWRGTSPRVFFVVNPSDDMRDRLCEFEERAKRVKNSSGEPCIEIA